jgi:hypothetical protein
MYAQITDVNYWNAFEVIQYGFAQHLEAFWCTAWLWDFCLNRISLQIKEEVVSKVRPDSHYKEKFYKISVKRDLMDGNTLKDY